MKNNVTILLIIMLAFLLSCSKDKPSSPSGPDYKLVESATVGPAGGTFGNEDFSLVVPAGAFSSDADLKLYETSEEQPYDEYGVSNTFRLEGLPADYSQSLEVRIKYRGTLTEESFVAAGEKVLYGDAGEEGFLFSHYPAADSLGYLVSQLPSPEDASGSFSGGHSLYGSHINAVDATTLHLGGASDRPQKGHHQAGGTFHHRLPQYVSRCRHPDRGLPGGRLRFLSGRGLQLSGHQEVAPECPGSGPASYRFSR